MSQARRSILQQLKWEIDDLSQFRFADHSAGTRCHAIHLETGTRVALLGANPRTAQGLVGCPLVICDEPGAWQVNAGQDLFDAVVTAQGKPGSDMKVILTGTLAPSMSGFWHDLVTGGSRGTTYVMYRAGNRKSWSKTSTIRRANPLMWQFPNSRAALLEERDEALKDSRLKARFLSFRLNVPSVDESDMLLAVADWERVVRRSVPPREGQPVVGVDLGSGRAWSAGLALWPNGRMEAKALAPGVPSVEEQERRDRVSRGTYQSLVDSGVLRLSTGRRVQTVPEFVDVVADWDPCLMVADRFRFNELLDADPSCPVQPRQMRWSDASDDIRGLRRLALDGNLSVERTSLPLLRHSFSRATVENDDAGNCRLTKSTKNHARDDVAQACVLAASAMARAAAPKPLKYTVVR